jgi:hypothetical protein
MALIRSFNILSRQKILISNQNVIRRHISDFGANLKPLKISYLGAPFDKGQVTQSLNLTIIDCLILFYELPISFFVFLQFFARLESDRNPNLCRLDFRAGFFLNETTSYICRTYVVASKIARFENRIQLKWVIHLENFKTFF